MEVTLELSEESVERIFKQEITNAIEDAKKDLDKVIFFEEAEGIFSWDYKEEKKYLKMHLKSLQHTLYYFTGIKA